jgi:hypothetical protein
MNEINQTPLLELGADLKPEVDLSRIQIKHKDTPHHLRPEMEKILTQMVGAGLIQRSPESIVKLIKKKDGSWRFIMDV